MSIPAVETVTAPTGMFGTPGTSATTAANGADKEMFLQLLVAQMRYQDPMNPTDSSQFLSQSAQFTSLEKMQEVADQTAQLLSAQVAFGAAGLVGREVTYTGPDGATATGLVSGVTFGAEGPVLDVAGSQVPLGSVKTVTTSTSSQSALPSTTSPASTTSPTSASA